MWLTYRVQHHGRGPKESWEVQDRNKDIHDCEVKAYKRLQEQGLCDRGVAPRFYGSVQNIDAQLYSPHLDNFLQDEYPPNAILLEYIPHMVPLYFKNYTKGRADNFLNGINLIQAAGIEHGDVYPRNMMVFEDDADPEREKAIWIDFNRAQTYDVDRLTPLQRGWMEFENGIAVEMMCRMKADFEKDEMDATKIFYY